MRNLRCKLLIILCLVTTHAMAVSVNGRVERLNSSSQKAEPALGTKVYLVSKSSNGFKSVHSFQVDSDGMYYFNNVTPGMYTLVVNRNMHFPIRVRQTEAQKLRPIRIENP